MAEESFAPLASNFLNSCELNGNNGKMKLNNNEQCFFSICAVTNSNTCYNQLFNTDEAGFAGYHTTPLPPLSLPTLPPLPGYETPFPPETRRPFPPF